MKLGEIKIEALQIMNATCGRMISPDMLVDIINEEDFREYLMAMPGAINRCFADLSEKRVLPLVSVALRAGEPVGTRMRFDVSGKDVDRVTYCEIDGEYHESIPYIREGDSILIEAFDELGEYRLLYREELSPVTSFTDEETELPIPNRIAVWIPYFIKSEIFRGDEPDEASAARNMYEQQMAQLATMEALKENRQMVVRSVYDAMEV